MFLDARMRTTIDLPEELLKRTKVLAAKRGSTMRKLIIEGLERTLSDSLPDPKSNSLPSLPVKGRAPYQLSNAEIEQLLLNEEPHDYGSSR